MAPSVYIIAGPNGAGKTTFAKEFLPNYADCKNFVNADLIAQGISPLSPETAAFRAGRLMLGEIDFYVRRGESFGFETTLSGRSYLRMLSDIKKKGYEIHIFFLWVSKVEILLNRIQLRVARGGHDVPKSSILRRFERSTRNFLICYQAIADVSMLFDSSGTHPSLIASTSYGNSHIINAEMYATITNRNNK